MTLAYLVMVVLSADPSVQAARTASAPEIDGSLEDAAWHDAPPYRSFVQNFPQEGAAPSEPTEVRVLYDDRFVYVGVKSFDSKPREIVSTLGRRDNPPASDLVTVIIDSTHDRRTGYSFSVSAGGVLRDGLYVRDTTFSTDWDGVWEGQSRLDADGWTAELAIPLSLLRFSDGRVQEWGFHVRRELARTHEVIDSTLIPRASNQFVSRFGVLRGVDEVKHRKSVELLPYFAARTAFSPDSSDRPEPRLLNPSADVGLDLRLGLTSNMALTATVNPDFGQVEADKLVLNLGNSEIFFPEKRPFFTQGLDLFVPAGAENGTAPHMLFYSRRIGLDTPVLSAAKLVGSATEGLDVGVLDAVVAGEPNSAYVGRRGELPQDGDPPNRSFRFLPGRPLHFGLENELPQERPVTRNYFAVVARKRVLGASKVGAWFTDSTPLSKQCYPEDFATDAEFREAGCEPLAQRSAAVDWDLRTSGGDWGSFGQLAGSQEAGSAGPRTLRDGTQLAPGDLGYGSYVRVGRLAGEGFRGYVQYEYASPKYDLNQIGFLGSQNVQSLWGEFLFVHPRKWGPWRESAAGAFAGRDWTTDGRMLNRGNVAGIWVEQMWPNFFTSGENCKWEYGGFDVREIPETGIGYQKAPSVMCAGGVTTDQTKAMSVHLEAYGFQNLPQGVLLARRGYGGSTWVKVRPTPRLESTLTIQAERPALTAKYVDTLGEDRYLFGGLRATQLSLMYQQQLVLTPELTLQAYAQLFSASGQFGPFYEGTYDGTPLRMDELVLADADPADYDFREIGLNVNVVLRWEYRLGSTVYAVYSRSQQGAPWSGVATAVPSLDGLGDGPTNDTFLLKWSWYWDAAI